MSKKIILPNSVTVNQADDHLLLKNQVPATPIELQMPELSAEEKVQLGMVVKLASDTLQQSMLAMIGENESVSLSCFALDNAFVISNFKETKTIMWVSDEEKEKAFANELVWSLYWGQYNYHASSIEAIIKKVMKL